MVLPRNQDRQISDKKKQFRSASVVTAVAPFSFQSANSWSNYSKTPFARRSSNQTLHHEKRLLGDGPGGTAGSLVGRGPVVQ